MLFYLILALLFAIIVIIQSSFFSFFFVGQALPDILLVFVIVLGFLMRERRGAILGLIAGLFQDILFGQALGYFALAKMILGFLAGLVGREVYRERIYGPLFLVFGGTLLHELLLFVMVNHFIGSVSFEMNMLQHIVIMALFNTLLTVLVFPLLYKLHLIGKRWGIKDY